MAPRQGQQQQQQRTMDAYGTARRRARPTSIAVGDGAALMGKEAGAKSSKAPAATVRARGLGGLRRTDATTTTTSTTTDVAAKNGASESVAAASPAAAAPAPAPAPSALDTSASPLGKRRVDPSAKVSPPKKQSVAGTEAAAAAAAAPAPPRARRSLRSLSEEKENQEEEEEAGEEATAAPAAAPAAAAAAAAAAAMGVPSRPQRRAAAAAVTFAPGVFSSDEEEDDDDDDEDENGSPVALAARPARTTARSYLSSWAPPTASNDDDDDDDDDGGNGPGVEFRVGDFAYVLLDESLFASSGSSRRGGGGGGGGSSSPSSSPQGAGSPFADGDNCVACGKGHKPLPGSQKQQQQQESKKQRGGRALSSGGSEEEEEDEEPSVPILECSACLAGYHLDCLDPPLESVPEADEWLCPPCERGETAERRAAQEVAANADADNAASAAAAPHFVARPALAPANPRTFRERFMAGQLGLVRIDALWRERPLAGNGGDKGGGGRGGRKKVQPKSKEETTVVRFRGPWLMLPEETHTGRRRGHGAREVFLSSHSCEHDAGSLVAAAGSSSFAAAASKSSSKSSKASSSASRPSSASLSGVAVVAEEELASTPGDDVYFCRYEYNASFRSFRALGAAGAALEKVEKKKTKKKKGRKSSGSKERNNGDDDDSDCSSSSSSDDDDDPADGDFHLRQPDLFDAWSRAGHRVARPASHSKGRAQTRRSTAAAAGGAAAAAPRSTKPRQGGGDDDVVVAALAGKLAAAVNEEAVEEEEVSEEEEAERRTASLPAAPAPAPAYSSSLSALARARAALAPSAPHCGLPCRDEERARLDAFIRGAAEDGGATSGRCLYVYGVPGTGKTASVLDAVRRASAASAGWNAKKKKKKTSKDSAAAPSSSSSSAAPVRPFRFVEINALRLPTPKHVYCRLLEAMWGERASPAAAHDLLNARIGAETAATAVPARTKAAAKKSQGGAAAAAASSASAAAAASKKKKKKTKIRNDEDFDSGDDEERNEGSSDSDEEDEEEEEEIEEEEQESDIATIVLVDEMDLLVTRNQTVLYNLFEWPARPRSGLAVIGVANTMDLPDRLLPRIASRFGSARLPFAPYGPAQLRAIVEARLRAASSGGGGEKGGSSALEAFEPRAVLYATRKVAAMAGDVRRALELCRMAADVAADEAREERRKGRKKGSGGLDDDDDEFDDNDDDDEFLLDCGDIPPASSSSDKNAVVVVSMRHVDAAVRAMFGAAHMQALSAAPLIDVLLLAALALELKASGRPSATVADLAPRVAELFASGGLLPSSQGSCPPAPSLGDVAASASRLAAQRVLVADAGDARARARVAFDVPVADVLAALRAQRGATAFVARLPFV